MSEKSCTFAAALYENMSEDQKVHIVKTAGELFFRLGIRSVSIDDICRELGMSKKTFYVYFESKDALIVQLLQANINFMARKMESLLAIEDFRKVVSEVVKQQRTKESQSDVRRVPQLVYDLKKYYPRQFEDFQHKAFEMQKSYIVQFLERGMANGLVRADLNVELTSVIFAKIYADALRDFELMEAHGHNVMQLLCVTMDICIRGVLNEEGMKLYN